MIKKTTTNFGVTFIELLMAIGILVILIGIFVPVFLFFQKGLELNNSAEEIINLLRISRSKTLASEGSSQYGVYFDSAVFPHQGILFKGDNFSLRDSSFDEVYKLPTSIEIYQINLGGGNEIVFDRITGNTSQPGDISLRLKTDSSKTKTIYIDGSGQVKLTVPVIPSDVDRIKDSRHLHFDYSRAIDTFTEKITLTIDGSVAEEIVIADFLKDGQIYWEGEGIKIHTHRLNSPDTQFCVHRDRRYNSKSLVITVSGDASGSLVDYSADGQESRGTSIYLAAGAAGDPQRQ